MKQREDELFGLAFGDIRGADAERLMANLDADDAQLVEELRGMKLDLQRLPVPDHQLSTERLRDAILNQGLQPKPVATAWWRMVAAPFAAAAIAVVSYQAIIGPNRNAAEAPNVISMKADQPTDRVTLDERFNPDLGAFSPEHWYDGSGSETISASPSTSRRSTSRGGGSFASRGGAAKVSAAPVVVESVTAAMTMAINSGATLDAPGRTADSMESTGNGGIVLIGSETDSTTGANRAIEVQDTKDVLIGG